MPGPAFPVDDFKRTDSETRPEYAEVLTEIQDFDPENPLANDWNVDPFEVEPELTTHYIESYFTYVNGNLYYMLPRGRFFLWLRSCQTKSLDDKMLLYWMMTMGAIFSDRPDRLMALKRYSRTARYAVEHNQHSLSLQLAQSRIIMSLWYFAIGSPIKSWDSVGAAVRTVCGLRYYIESGGVSVDPSWVCEYGLHPQALIECRRRTFWVAFLMDRFSSFYSPSSVFIPQTSFLRLPCREETYEAQQYATVPYHQSFLDHGPAPSDDLSALSAMAFLVEITSLWGDVSHHVFQLSLTPPDEYSKLFDDFHTTTAKRADTWSTKLPDHLKFTAINLETSIRAKKADTFVSMHLVYHATLMKLNRHARYLTLPPGTVDRHIRRARHHAVEILRMVAALTQYASELEASKLAAETPSPKMTVLNPFVGYVILSAVDVLSGAGLIADLPESINLMKSSFSITRELARFWDAFLPVVSLIETRVDAMIECLHYRTEDKIGFVIDSPSLESQSRASISKHPQSGSSDEDLMYSLPREIFFKALGIDDFVEEYILWLKSALFDCA